MKWRLILDGAASGAWNMAVDETLLLSTVQSGAPALRFYDWQPSCLSLGRFQKWSDIENRASNAVDPSDAVEDFALPFDVVRRPTGGRAVWHQAEITYCAVLREVDLPPHARSVAGAYRWLSGGFLHGLNALGIDASLAPGVVVGGEQSGKTVAQTPNCFSSATRADFVVQGRKLIGAAQVRRDGVVLQHGSLLLDVDEDAWRRAIGGSLQDVVSLRSLGVGASRTQIIDALCRGCERALEADFASSALSSVEADVAVLRRDKYASRLWNQEARLELGDAETKALQRATERLGGD